jgi:hypothetical protein
MNFSFFLGTPVMSCPMLQSTLRKKNFYTTLLCGQALLRVTGFDASGGNENCFIHSVCYEYIKFRSEYYPPRGNGAFKYLVKSEVKIRGATKPPQSLPPL